MNERITYKGPVWRWTGNSNGAWHFVTIDGEAGESLTAIALMRRLEGAGRGFGSLRVVVKLGDTIWQTSVFPQKGAGWMLPVRKAVLRAEDIVEGDQVALEVDV
ncbi:MAG: DUF1905 domain-containing protein [Novosphingobium sp.]|nr:DUF1905 domain-containing protein [Novosphingobium sp.]